MNKFKATLSAVSMHVESLHPRVQSWVKDWCEIRTSCVKGQAPHVKFTVLYLQETIQGLQGCLCVTLSMAADFISKRFIVFITLYFICPSHHPQYCYSEECEYEGLLHFRCAPSCGGTAVSINNTPTLNVCRWERDLLYSWFTGIKLFFFCFQFHWASCLPYC